MFKLKKGRSTQAGNADVAFFLGFFAVLFVLWWASGGGQKGADGKPKPLFSVSKIAAPTVVVRDDDDYSADESSSGGGNNKPSYSKDGEPLSPWYGKVKISSLGTASSQYDPDFEYIVLKAGNSKELIDVTGWSLLNGRNRNAVSLGISQQKGIANQVYLPEARLVYLIDSLYALQPIRLASGGEVVVTTGRAPSFGGSGSFRINKCLGYLEDEDKFYPNLANRCPDPEIEPGIEFLDDDCRDFVADMASCHTPKFKSYTESSGRRRNKPSVDNVPDLSVKCRNYLREHYSYRGCVNNHLNDQNFYSNQWRVYLNRPWEMWVKGDEVITLFDDRGLMVDRKSY